MAKKNSKSSGIISNGGRKKANIAHEAKRQAKFATKRENGITYKYTSNPYEKGTKEWHIEREARAEKNKSSRLSYARWASVMAKLDNQLEKEKAEILKKKSKVKSVNK